MPGRSQASPSRPRPVPVPVRVSVDALLCLCSCRLHCCWQLKHLLQGYEHVVKQVNAASVPGDTGAVLLSPSD